MPRRRVVLLAAIALAAFAANSVLARLALGPNRIDPGTFTAIRLAAGAATLALIHRVRSGPVRPRRQNLAGALLLFLYAAPFSFAYVTLPAGTGALILFGAVQLTMFSAGLRAGERPAPREWIGLAAAVAGLVYLNLPGVEAAPLPGFLLMTTAGVAWGLYSLRGRRAEEPLRLTTESFLWATPLALLLPAVTPNPHLSPAGVAAAVASGALASGVGYAVWYTALPGLKATRAGMIQQAVPVLAALAGAALLSEPVTLRLVLAALLVLGGVAFAVRARSPS
ncbi:MAG: DMT family transporter [Gemmatimonadales bacterium]|nr:DMT family transporter [Gemmatimonadales bacterium]